jgi:hypothetical protein
VDKWEFSLLELGCLYKVWLAYKCLRLVERLKVEWLGLMIGLMIGMIIGLIIGLKLHH